MTRMLAAFLGLLTLSTAAAAQSLDIPAADGGLVTVEVNGVPLRLRVDPGANGIIVLNRSAAERAGLKDGPIDADIARAYGIEQSLPFRGEIAGTPLRPGTASKLAEASATNQRTRTVAQVGPLRAQGAMAAATIAVGKERAKRLFTWFDGGAVRDSDGVISPGALPFDRVTIHRSAPARGERRLVLRGEYRPVAGFVMRHAERERPMLVKVSLTEPRTIATAAAGAVIAESLGGGWSGESSLHPIALNLQRPVRPLRLGRTMDIGGLRIGELLVRTGDHRGAFSLPPDSAAEADEVVVTAKSGQPPRFYLVIGEDALAGCSSVSFDRKETALTLSCPR